MNKRIRNILRTGRNRKYLRRFVSVISCIVVFCTTYALLLPAITMEKTASCGIEAHEHSDSCYEEQLICGQEETEGHQHNDDCYQVDKTLICAKEEHSHTEDCYDRDGNLTCALEEHSHVDECLREDRVLVCPLQETEGHTHTSACYEKVLVCGKEIHVHGPGCYKQEDVSDGSERETWHSNAEKEADSDSTEQNTQSSVEKQETGSSENEQETVISFDERETDLSGDTKGSRSSGSEQETVPVDPAQIMTAGTSVWYREAGGGDYDWKRVKDKTVLCETDEIRLYYAYTIPAGTLDSTGSAIGLPLPDVIQLTDEQIRDFNASCNGRGAEAAEGTRTPDTEPEGAEWLLACVHLVSVEYEGMSSPVIEAEIAFEAQTIEKNRGTYDENGEPVIGGQDISGFFSIDLYTDCIRFAEKSRETVTETVETEDGTADRTTEIIRSEAKIIQVQKDSSSGIKEISTTLRKETENVLEEKLRPAESSEEKDPGTESENRDGRDTDPEEKNQDGQNSDTDNGRHDGQDAGTESGSHDGQDADADNGSHDGQDAGRNTDENSRKEETSADAKEKSDAVTLNFEGPDYTVTASFDETAGFPEGAELAVSEILPEDPQDADRTGGSDADSDGERIYSKYVTNMESALGMRKGSAVYIRLFDIKIVDENGEKIQPAEGSTVDVKIELADAQSAGLSVVHFADGAENGDVVETTTRDAGDGKAISFEADGFSIYAITDEPGENARIGYRFWYNDGAQNVLLSTQYFRYKDVHPDEGTALTINEPSIPDVDSTTWNRIFRGWSKTGFNDDDSNLITVETLNNELNGLAESDYSEGTFIDLFANLKDVYYVTYVDVNPNNILATEIVPRAESGTTTFNVKPESELRPTIDSDTVLQGWYDINNPGTVYTPGQGNVAVDKSITLYPKIEGGSWLIFDDNDLVWDESRQEYVSGGASFTPPAFYLDSVTQEPAEPVWAGYEFGGWYTDRECTTPFTFGGNLSHDTTVYAKWIPSSSQYRVIIWKQRTSDSANTPDAGKNYDYVTSFLDESVVTGQTVTLNASYKNIYGSSGTSTDADKAYFIYNAARTDQSVVVKADGTSVLNVYYDRKPVTLNFYTYGYTYTVSTNDNDNNPYKYGDVNGEKARVYWRNGAFRTTDRNNGPVYNGTVYTRSNSQSWQLYETMTGLYGSTFAQNGYSWPTEYWWYDTGNNSGGTSGTRTTVMTAFLPTDVNTTGNTIVKNFYGKTSSGTARINFYVQELDGSYTLREYVTSGGGNFYITDKYIGYHAAQYRANNSGNWNGAGTPNSSGYYNNGSGVSYSSQLDIRFDLNNYTLTFYTNNGSNQVVDYSVPYSKPLAEYAGQNPGQRAGHYFLGWFADPGCTEPFDFSQTMPDNNIAVYGKWRLERFRIVIEPGANNVYMGSQATRFRLDYDERIDGGLLETATRAGYILDGWYTDPDFTDRFLFSNPVNTSTSGVDMTYHDSPSWAAARAAYGDDTEAYDNVRGILHLYAKWVPDPSSTGINVVYDPGDAAIYDSLGTLLTTVPIDTHMYGFDGTATAREAPSNYNDLYTFKYWEATTEDGDTVHFYPGDPVTLDDLTFTDPIYDEGNGELIRKTVTLRAVYDQTGDPSRITHITYDGNSFTDNLYSGTPAVMHGETRDGTHRYSVTLDEEINQTITLPSADDFYLEGWELVGWSFTEGTYAEQVAEATPEAPNFTPGQRVAADNLIVSSLNDEENTLYAMWHPKEYTVTVRQVIEEGVPVNNFAYAYKRGVEDDIENAAEQVKTLTGSNASFTEEHFGYYERVGDVIRVTTPTPTDDTYDVRVNAIVTKDDGTTEILNPTAAGDYQILGDVVITYTYSLKVPVKLQKRDATDHSAALTGAEFVVTPVEFNTSTQRWENAGSGRTITIDAATIEQYLQEGTYRITEMNAPDQYAKISEDLYLTVKKDEPFTLFTAGGSAVDSSVAELDNTGRILTVYDNPVRTVTLTKLIEGGGEGTFTFKVTVFNSDGTTRLAGYTIGEKGGNTLTTNNIGEVTLSLGDQESVALNIPHGSKITVEETQNLMYLASYTWNNPEEIEGNVFGSEPVEITADGALTFTNRHALQKLRIKKTRDDAPDGTPDGLAGAVFSLTAKQGTTISGFSDLTGLTSMDGTANASNIGFLPGNDASDPTLFTLPNGTYTLTETGEPDYYAGLGGAVTLTVSADGITAAAASGDESLISMSAPDAQGIYTLTVENMRKKATVKVVKNVRGVTTDQNTPFNFTVTGLSESADSFPLYGTAKAAEGTEPEHLHEKEYTDIPFGTKFTVTEADAYTAFDTSITVLYSDNTSVDLDALTTGELTVNGDITITYTNTRNSIPLKVVKTDQSGKPLAGAVFSGNLITGGSVTTQITGGSVTTQITGGSMTTQITGGSMTTQITGTGDTAEAIIIEDSAVPLGTYTIEENTPPPGYYPLAGPVKIEVKTDESGNSGDILVTVTVNDETSAFASAERVDIDHPELGWIVTVKNDSGMELPHTGGSGTGRIYIIGFMMTALAGIGILMGIQMRKKNSSLLPR